MISFRLSEEEYSNLRNLCENEGARSVSDLARDAVHRLVSKGAETQVAVTLQELKGRLDTLDLQVQRLSMGEDPSSAQMRRHTNGKA